MRTERETVLYVHDLGKPQNRRRQQALLSTKKEAEGLIIKDSVGSESNSENISPSNKRNRRAVNETTASPMQSTIVGGVRKVRRRAKSAVNKANAAEKGSLPNLDYSDVNESLEQSKLTEEASLSINGIEEATDKSPIRSDSIDNTPNSSAIFSNDENGSSRKLQSNPRLGFNAKDTTTNEAIDDGFKDHVILDDSAIRIKADSISKTYAVMCQEETDRPPSKMGEEHMVVDVKLEDPMSENFNYQEEKEVDIPMPIVNIKSPSAVSVDSAKGSSIANDSDCTIFATGDLYWGRIPHFSYWACIICPDDSDNDNLITRLVDHQMEVHVRFFADNARRNWVRRDNLIPYQGLESYHEYLRDLKEKVGGKNIKYQSFLPKKTQLKTWLSAAKEADIIASTPYPERLAKFYELTNVARERNKEERIRRKSVSVSLSTKKPNTDIDSPVTNQDTANKRNRSESPVSPAFSPLRTIKRRKTTADASDLMLNRQQSVFDETPNFSLSESAMATEYNSQETPRNNKQIYDTSDFHDFYDIMKTFVMQGLQSEFVEKNLFVAVKNIWALKTILNKQFLNAEINTSNNNIEETPGKRLSLRLKDLQQRQKGQENSIATSSILSTTQNIHFEERRLQNSFSKNRKVTRPIEEVIDDIFNLDSRYLFENMSRDPVCKYCHEPGNQLRRCSKSGCFTWFHRECAQTENVPRANNSLQKANGSAAIVKRRLTKKDSKESSAFSPNIRPIVHVTGDTDENDNEKFSLEKMVPISANKALETSLTNEFPNETILCNECTTNEPPKCFVCQASSKQNTSANGKVHEENVIACNTLHCGRVYHPSCLKYWPQAKITMSKNVITSLRCPSHVCQTCVSDDPKGKFQHLNNSNTIKCVKCPATYHMDSTCIPAGSKVLTAAHIICPRHAITKNDRTVNVSWCFICVRGGQLICCETCPTAVHAECSNVALDPNEIYICDECESGRMPLYGEMVWAKFNQYRWWPAIILPPTEVPMNIRSKVHNPFEFVIRFFGTHDHGWISRRRVYLYLEGDWSEQPRSKKSMDQNYLRGVREAKEIYEIIKAKTLVHVSKKEGKEKLHPQPYAKIRVNRAISPVKLHPDLEKVSKCECDPAEENPCGPDSNCLNRVLYHECNPKICLAGQRCQNQMFEARISPTLEIFYAKKERGFGLRCRETIVAGTFIIEYVGEVIDSVEFQRRMQQKSTDRDENYYFLHVEKDYIIDAGPKGNMARFMNHSCDPNCETQKWSVNGLNRVGLFAIKDIPADTELTFNYHWDELLGNDKKACYCGSEKCTGQIGKLSKDAKLKQINSDEQLSNENSNSSKADQLKSSKKRKRRKSKSSKSSHQKSSKNDAHISKKPKRTRKKKGEISETMKSTSNKSNERSIENA